MAGSLEQALSTDRHIVTLTIDSFKSFARHIPTFTPLKDAQVRSFRLAGLGFTARSERCCTDRGPRTRCVSAFSRTRLRDESTAYCSIYSWHLDNLYNLVVEQLDPIVSPNAQSSHMHRILGGSNFAAAYNFDELAASSCTSAAITVDHSSYWAPQLYWITDPANPANTSFMQICESPCISKHFTTDLSA